MKKRGQLVYKALVVLIGSALIIAGFVQAGKSHGSQEAFYKLAVAKDLALTIDVIYSLPSDIEYTYPNDVSGYDVDINGNRVAIHSTGGSKDTTSQSYGFVGLSNDALNFQLKNQKFIKFKKINGKMNIVGVSG